MATAPAKKTPTAKSTNPAAHKAAGSGKPALASVKPADERCESDASEIGKNPVLRLRDLVNRVSEGHDHKKKDIKEIIETALAEMAKALDNNENMMLPSLGKVRIVRQGDVATGVPMTLKLRRSNPASSTEVADDKDSLAQDGEDS